MPARLPLAALLLSTLVTTGCSGAVEGDDEEGRTEDALAVARCAQSSQRANPACVVAGTVESGFAGELGPRLGEHCVLFVRELGGARVWGLVEEGACERTGAFLEGTGAHVRFHKGDLEPISSRALRSELKAIHATASFHRLAGPVGAGHASRPFEIECSAGADACRKESELGACLDGLHILDAGQGAASVVLRTSASTASGRRPFPDEHVLARVDATPTTGAGASAGPDHLRVELDPDRWVTLHRDPSDRSRFVGAFNFHAAVRFEDEYESVPIRCADAR